MSDWRFPFCPQPPDWKLNWSAIESAVIVLRTLADVQQDPIWHAEGDVLTHTRMVAEAMVCDAEWRALPELDRHMLFISSLLHDIGKPTTTRIEDGRIRSPRHSIVGQRMARRFLWEATNAPDFKIREAITSLVRYHGLPIMFIEKPRPERAVIEASQTIRCDYLAMLARADVLGRKCPDAADLLDRISLFQELCSEQDCLAKPKAFESSHHRFIYFNAGSDYGYVPYDDTRCEVTLMSGLPATGKDYWVARSAGELPVISLDELRTELEIDPTDGQGKVMDVAKHRAKELLRKSQSFIWNATNITRELRQQLIALFANYKASVRLVYTESPPDVLRRRNNSRSRPVPTTVIDRMITKLEVPTIVEAHHIMVVESKM